MSIFSVACLNIHVNDCFLDQLEDDTTKAWVFIGILSHSSRRTQIFERNGRVYTEIVPDCKKKTLQAIIHKKIAVESIINSDGWRGYSGLVDVGYGKHFRVNHGKHEFSKKNGVHINGIESFWSFTKIRLTKFNGVKATFLLHLKESEWRWSKIYEIMIKELNIMYKKYKKNLKVLHDKC